MPSAATIQHTAVTMPTAAPKQHARIRQAAAQFPPITLGEMDSVKLLNRIDTKYLTTEAILLEVLADALKAGYRALETPGPTAAQNPDTTAAQAPDASTTKLSPYNSVYYDTPGLKTFLDHHNKRLTRQKVRTRVYVNSGDTFLEIKRKNNHGRTKKKRTSIATNELMDFSTNAAATAYLAKHSMFTAEELSPALSTAFERITLVNPDMTERLTIDTALKFENFRTGKQTDLSDAVIIELKQDGRAESQMKGILLNRRVKPLRVSKYCVGITLTDRSIKSNRFKEKVRAIEKIINKKIQVI